MIINFGLTQYPKEQSCMEEVGNMNATGRKNRLHLPK